MKRLLLIFPAVLTVAVLTVDPTEAGGLMQGKRLVRASNCSRQVLMGAHRYRTLRTRTKVECLRQCVPDQRCKSIVYDKNSLECHLGDSNAFQNCSNMEVASGSESFYQEVSLLSLSLSLSLSLPPSFPPPPLSLCVCVRVRV